MDRFASIDDRPLYVRVPARSSTLLSAVLIASLLPVAAHAQSRPEKASRAIVTVERGCLVTPELDQQQRDAQPSRLGPILGALVAGVAGNLVTSGLNAAGNAIEAASQEKAFVAEGVGSFTAYRIDNGGDPTKRWSAVPDLEVEVLASGAAGAVPDGTEGVTAARCLVLVSTASTKKTGGSGSTLSAADIKSAFAATGLDDTRASNAEARLRSLGIQELPDLYIEAELLAAADGFIVQPVLIRYATPISGAPKSAAATEFHASFALPGAPDTSDVGTIFALARISLPKMTPGEGTVFTRSQLTPYASAVVPLRSTAGLTESTLAARNALVASIETNKVVQNQLKEALRLAQRALDQNRDRSKQVELTNARDDAQLALAEATREGAALVQRAKAEPVSTGSTNVKARFLVIRKPNEFGLAIAKALKSQADTTGAAVTERLKPQPEWTSQDTAYVDAEAAVRAAERAVDEAIAGGKTSDVPGLQDALTKAKAKANEAAVAAGRQLPYAIIP